MICGLIHEPGVQTSPCQKPAGHQEPWWTRPVGLPTLKSKTLMWWRRTRKVRKAARQSERDRRALIAEIQELAYLWDGPGSEGRCV
jgi:hypothetical protein